MNYSSLYGFDDAKIILL